MNISEFSKEWIDSWNSHDIETILSHYSDDFSLKSPAVLKVLGTGTGELKGKDAIAAYWKMALSKFPQLHFELISCYEGINCLAIHYKGINDTLVVELMQLNKDGKVSSAEILYGKPLT
jgi:hypothetical protein